MKPGYKSTEFWVTAGIQAAGFLGLFGFFSVAEVGELNTKIPEIGTLVGDIVIKVSAVVGMVVSAYRYIIGRSDVKKAEASK